MILEIYKKCVTPQEDAIKLAALLGLARHLEWDDHRNDPPNPRRFRPT